MSLQRERYADLSFINQYEYSSKGYMGGGDINYGELEGDERLQVVFKHIGKLQSAYPDILSKRRKILEPGSGSGAVSLHLYKYFLKHVFLDGFPPDFQHLGVEITAHPDDWYQQQAALEELDLPSSPKDRFASHYTLQKGTNFLDFAKDASHHGRFDLIFELAIYDLIGLRPENPKLFHISRQLLKPGGLLIISLLDYKRLNDDPIEAGFERLLDNGRNHGPTFWEAV